ncbi:MAG: hypothetical protein J6L77_06345 [Coprococcus sp.]|nr:hypothetical protein [Coprococcus sp.]
MVNLIQQKYGEACQLRSPLTKKQYNKAHKFLPDELFLRVMEPGDFLL